MPNRTTLKREARELNRTAKVNAYSFSLLFFVITLAIQALRDYINRDAVLQGLQERAAMLRQTLSSAELSLLMERIDGIVEQIPLVSSSPRLPAAVVTFVVVMAWLLNCLLSAGYTLYIMGIRQGKAMGYGTLFDGFAFAGKIILLDLWRSLVISLWSLLFVVPGIIASYRYSFALYNLLNDPEMGVTEAMALSKQQTQGHKWGLFVLNLSFLGWELLTPLTAGILSIYVRPYREQAWMGYYRAAAGTGGEIGGDIPPQEENYQYRCVDDENRDE